MRAFQIAGPPGRDARFFASMMLLLPTFVFWGTLFGLYLWIKTAVSGIATPTGTIMLALLPLVLGFQLLLEAIVLDVQETPK